jgi:hypothetical protein
VRGSASGEDDDLIPVCLGGDNASPLYLPQSYCATPGAADKDALEGADLNPRNACYKQGFQPVQSAQRDYPGASVLYNGGVMGVEFISAQ